MIQIKGMKNQKINSPITRFGIIGSNLPKFLIHLSIEIVPEKKRPKPEQRVHLLRFASAILFPLDQTPLAKLAVQLLRKAVLLQQSKRRMMKRYEVLGLSETGAQRRLFIEHVISRVVSRSGRVRALSLASPLLSAHCLIEHPANVHLERRVSAVASLALVRGARLGRPRFLHHRIKPRLLSGHISGVSFRSFRLFQIFTGPSVKLAVLAALNRAHVTHQLLKRHGLVGQRAHSQRRPCLVALRTLHRFELLPGHQVDSLVHHVLLAGRQVLFVEEEAVVDLLGEIGRDFGTRPLLLHRFAASRRRLRDDQQLLDRLVVAVGRKVRVGLGSGGDLLVELEALVDFGLFFTRPVPLRPHLDPVYGVAFGRAGRQQSGKKGRLSFFYVNGLSFVWRRSSGRVHPLERVGASAHKVLGRVSVVFELQFVGLFHRLPDHMFVQAQALDPLEAGDQRQIDEAVRVHF
ncbi:hypothetical protein BpHYR1_004558 [Brachionus plicatilis]|uniref:Uncharacterized protein n=1 Tax=Brachionus plicatilis TaxID=10195 RepID=A0A3M7PA01_BRAPC|nr:hypothetical protein BpHYR1_004558 [Brachionus plicatilis]